jgi:hypothetical protein
MTRDELLSDHRVMSDKARVLMAKKNHDYANGSDAFRNFRRHGAEGILVRLGDKLARLESFNESGKLAIKNESILDTCLDIMNYAVLFHSYLKDAKEDAHA